MVMRSSTVQVKWYRYMYQKIKTVSVGGLFSCEHMNDYPTCISNSLSLTMFKLSRGRSEHKHQLWEPYFF